jgi:hypothetical protein
MAPSLTGRGWGWVVFFAAEAVRRFPAHRLKIPPQVPLAIRRGRVGGARWDDWRTGCPSPRSAQRRGRCASLPGAAVAAQPTARPRAAASLRPTCHQGSASGRLARRSSPSEHFKEFGLQRPGFGRGGDRGGVRGARAPSGAQRSDLRAGPIAMRASVMHSMTDKEACDPRARERAAACLSRLCRPDRVRVRDGSPSRGETPVPRWLDAQRNSPAPRSGETPRPIET